MRKSSGWRVLAIQFPPRIQIVSRIRSHAPTPRLDRLNVVDAVDCRRAEMIVPDRQTRFVAEMKVPGTARLQLEVEPHRGGSFLRHTAVSDPLGLFGLAYWHAPKSDLQAVGSFDAERLTHMLLVDWARLGPIPYPTTRIGPLIRAVGEGQRRDSLRSARSISSPSAWATCFGLRIPYEDRARGPRIVLATLTGEEYGLGLQMAALILAGAGWRLLLVGTNVPAQQIAAVANERKAEAVGLGVSVVTRGPLTRTATRRL